MKLRVLLVIGVLMVVFSLWNALPVTVPLTRVTIPSSSSLPQVAEILSTHGLIRSKLLFYLQIISSGQKDRVRAGNHSFSGTLWASDVISILLKTQPVGERRVLIPEGLRSDQIAEKLEKEGVASADAVLLLVRFPKKSWLERWPWLRNIPDDQGLEGFLFGDTYAVDEHTTAEIFITRMLETFDRKVYRPLEADVTANAHPFWDVMRLASIVEKEVPRSDDRAKVAFLFWQRIDKNIPLQADSTINYITGRTDPRARAQDLLIASGYNTYKMRGLPPGPISNPSRDAIQATIKPITHPNFYFLTTPDGTVIYNRTFAEHVSSKQKYYPKGL